MTDHAVEYVWTIAYPQGWQAECSCGWKGPHRIAETVSYEDGRRHLAAERVTP